MQRTSKPAPRNDESMVEGNEGAFALDTITQNATVRLADERAPVPMDDRRPATDERVGHSLVPLEESRKRGGHRGEGFGNEFETFTSLQMCYVRT
jgi:hypothetical protein